jgi:epsilon-lactone hydrolase
MGKIINHQQSRSDKLIVTLLKQAAKLYLVRDRADVHFKLIFTNELSENYKYSRGIKFETIDVSGCKVEVISKKKSIQKYALMHLHGGAYVLNYNDTYRKAAKKYLNFKDNLTVFSPIYSLAPKHPFPEALNDAVNVYKHMLQMGYKPENIMFAGDSAGGGLSIATGLYLKENNLPLPKAMITLSPWTDLTQTGKSWEDNKFNDPLFGEGTNPLNVKAYTGDNDLYNPLISPKYGDFEDFCNLLMIVGGHEVILSDTLDVAEKVDNAIVHEFAGMFHVFPLAFNKMKSARIAWKIMKKYLNENLK